METNRIKELLEQLKQKLIIGNPYYQSGICNVISGMYQIHIITFEERNFLRDYVMENKPSIFNQYKEFMNNKYWTGEMHWWGKIFVYPETKQIRIDFITALIDNIK